MHEAEDLVQEFFARLLKKDYLGHADPARGRFRTFLLSSLKNFLMNDWKHAHREKRGGGQTVLSLDANSAEVEYLRELADDAAPDRVYERCWAMTLLERVLAQLGTEYRAHGSSALFDQLKTLVWGHRNTTSYGDVAAQLGMSEGAVKVAMHRLRQRFREALRTEIAKTVATPAEVDEELRHLIRVMSD
jgi:RNA polymerase sigma-70 factor (ECF subfamily)